MAYAQVVCTFAWSLLLVRILGIGWAPCPCVIFLCGLVCIHPTRMTNSSPTSSCRMFNLDNVGSGSWSILNSSVLPTMVVGPYRAIHVVPKISQDLRAIRLCM